MELIVTSDTHHGIIPDQFLDEINKHKIFVHCGDLMNSGTETEWAARMMWLSKVTCKYKYLCPGNHDFYMALYGGAAEAELRSLGFVTLNQRVAQLPGGITIGGMPCVVNLRKWAFNFVEEEWEDRLEAMGRVDILVTHSPPLGWNDYVPIGHRTRPGHAGSRALKDYVAKHQPRLHLHGHIHEGYGVTVVGDTTIVNAAMCDGDYKQTNPPIKVECK